MTTKKKFMMKWRWRWDSSDGDDNGNGGDTNNNDHVDNDDNLHQMTVFFSLRISFRLFVVRVLSLSTFVRVRVHLSASDRIWADFIRMQCLYNFHVEHFSPYLIMLYVFKSHSFNEPLKIYILHALEIKTRRKMSLFRQISIITIVSSAKSYSIYIIHFQLKSMFAPIVWLKNFIESNSRHHLVQ